MKAILFVRVSTEAQDYSQQTEVIKRMALADGFKETELILIAEKESGIKLSEEERLGINQLKQYINTEHIDCVYCFEISRIARTEKVLYSIRDFLLEKKVQLKIYEPTLTLLDKDGNLDSGADWAFTIFAKLASQEMSLRKARFKNGKEKNKKLGKYNGGNTIPFGFKVDENGFVVVDSDKAIIIHELFNLYANGSNIYYLNQYLKRVMDKPFARGYLHQVLKNKAYRDSIVEAPLFDKVQQIKEKNKSIGKGNHLYLTKQLVICDVCGKYYVSCGKSMSCVYHTNIYKDDEKYCSNNLTISTTFLDNFVWEQSKGYIKKVLSTLTKGRIEDIKNELAITDKKIDICNKTISESTSKLERLDDLYIDGRLTKDKYALKAEYIQSGVVQAKEDLKRLYAKKKALNQELLTDGQTVIDIDNIDDDEKYRLIHKYINVINYKRDGVYRIITINYQDGTKKVFALKGVGKYMKKYEVVNNEYILI